MLAAAIQQSQTMVARQVVRTEGGEEKLLNLHDISSNDKENPALPAYLSDDDSPVKVGRLAFYY